MRRDREGRERSVLDIIISSYVEDASPVGSRFVSKKLGLSSATIRNVMQDLEEDGLIAQPHTSAGRVPTDKGYRYYIDSLMRLKRLTERQISRIDSEFHSRLRSLEELLEKTSHILSAATNCAGIALLPKIDQRLFRHIELLPLARTRVLVLLITSSGFVKNFMIELDYMADEGYLRKIANFLNRELYNMTLDEIRGHFLKKLEEERDSSYKLIQRAYGLVEAILLCGVEEELYIDGASHILSQPEFQDRKKMTSIMKFFEDKKPLVDILSGDIADAGLKVHIGRENDLFGLGDFSIITKGYKTRDEMAGRLGVIGPTRMDYERIIPMVDYLADTISRIMLDSEEGL